MQRLDLDLANISTSMEVIPRLNAIVTKLDLRMAILGSVQSMGYDSPTDEQMAAISMFLCQ